MTDPIADMLTRIRNAQAVNKQIVEVPFSKIRFEIGKVLERTGFLEKVELKTKRSKRPIELTLKYKEGVSVISGTKRISTPGKRMYVNTAQLTRIVRKRGVAIISTSKGIMTAGEAKTQGLGGELLGEIW